jgi:hypothetical protein
LGIIWIAFLLPLRRGERSPASSVDDFERRMSMLAEADRPSPGRWVVMPRKDERFVGPRDRERLRIRDRRRRVFTFLLEACALTLIMGLFPPLRSMLLGTGVLILLLVAYAAMLVNIKAREAERLRARRSIAPNRPPGVEVGGRERVHAFTEVDGLDDPRAVFEAGVRLLDDDVHVVVRRAGEIEREPVGAPA